MTPGEKLLLDDAEEEIRQAQDAQGVGTKGIPRHPVIESTETVLEAGVFGFEFSGQPTAEAAPGLGPPEETTGACCDGEDCTITTEAGCPGVYQGNGTDCEPNPCIAMWCVDVGVGGANQCSEDIWRQLSGSEGTGARVLMPFPGTCTVTLTSPDELGTFCVDNSGPGPAIHTPGEATWTIELVDEGGGFYGINVDLFATGGGCCDYSYLYSDSGLSGDRCIGDPIVIDGPGTPCDLCTLVVYVSQTESGCSGLCGSGTSPCE